MAGCAFCAIVNGAPHIEVYSDNSVVALLDRAPLVPGHTLVIPRRHIETLEDLPADLLAPFFGVVQKLSRAFSPALGAEGSLVAINTRISQSVPHVHAHAVPRRKGDRLFSPSTGPMLWIRRSYGEGEAEAVAAKLRAALV
ncbi:MAG: HIT family protein [Chloroflexi bacterium]|nr:MAG: HIT family protein [Chloroflexota bacterium]